MATIKDIAMRLGVSPSTVSKGLNGANDISEELRQMVLDTAIELGYSPKKIKKSITKRVCIFVENMDFEESKDFGYDIILGFKQAAIREGWEVDIMPITPAFQLKEKYDTYMLKCGYNGGFFVGFALHDDWLSQLESTTIPTVLFDNYIPKNPNVCLVGTDNEEGIALAVEHLALLGHKKIAFLNGSSHSMVTEQRHLAFENSMNSLGLEFDEELAVYGYFVADVAKYHVPDFLSAGATAILCGNDLIASGVVTECRKRGFSVPGDISVVGFDDLPIASTIDPPLTTIRQDRTDLGKCAHYALNCLINHVAINKTLLRPELIVRTSTGKRSETEHEAAAISISK